jgi:hypothetical protein
MTSHQPSPEWDPLVVRRSGAGYAENLDAWLGTEALAGRSDRMSSRTDRDVAADWDAPSRDLIPVYDTATQSLPAGVRAVLHKDSRRLLLETQDYEMLLWVTPHALTDGYELNGQLLLGGLPLSGAAVRTEADDLDSIAQTDQAGGFRRIRMRGRTFRLSVTADGYVLEASPMVLGNAED